MSDRVRRLALTGRVRGSAVIGESRGVTRAEIGLQGGRGRFTVIAAGKSGLETAELVKGRAEFRMEGVCALALAQEGRLAAVGFAGPCNADRETLIARMRLAASEAYETEARVRSVPSEEKRAEAAARSAGHAPGAMGDREPQRGRAANGAGTENAAVREPQRGRAANGAETENAGNASPVTPGILEQARRLFGMLYPDSGRGNGGAAPVNMPREANGADVAGRMISPREATEPAKESGGMRRVSNPFPGSFPGWEWFEAEGGVLEGRRGTGGGPGAAAYPLAKNGRIRGRGRMITARDGRRYYVELL